MTHTHTHTHTHTQTHTYTHSSIQGGFRKHRHVFNSILLTDDGWCTNRHIYASFHFRAAKISMLRFVFVTGWGGDVHESTPAPLNTMNLLSFRANKSSLICSKPAGIGRFEWYSMILISVSRLLEEFFLILIPLEAAFIIKPASSKGRGPLSELTFSWGLVLLLEVFDELLRSFSPVA